MEDKIYKMSFASVYPLYIQKAERKKRTKEEVDKIIFWLTGYTKAGLKKQIERQADLETFFARAPKMNPRASLIQGVVCGVRVENIKEPLMRKIRYLDKLVDELAQGKELKKILRSEDGPSPTKDRSGKKVGTNSPMSKLRKELIKRLERIPGLKDRPSKVAGGSAIFFNEKEIAHFHHDNEIDIRLTKKVIRQEGLNHPDDSKIHKHRSPTSEWIEIRFHREKDVDEVVRLFKLALEQYR